MTGEIYFFFIVSTIVLAVFILYLGFVRPVVGSGPTRTFMPIYCQACHTRVEYDYERNCYFCPEHGQLIFLIHGIPIELISDWYPRLKEAEGR